MGAIYKKSGFKDGGGLFWINERGKYGVRYQCKTCCKDTLGFTSSRDSRMHLSSCAERWSGMCEAGKHGLDYRGQVCDLCAATTTPSEERGETA